MTLTSSITTMVMAIVMGLTMAGLGEMMLAVKEIALNTRKEEKKETYSGLSALSTVMCLVGGLVIVAGVVVFVLALLGKSPG